ECCVQSAAPVSVLRGCPGWPVGRLDRSRCVDWVLARTPARDIAWVPCTNLTPTKAMILTMRLAFTAHATIIAAPRHHNCCYHNVPPNGRLAPPSFPACSCPPLSMAETFNPATSPGGAVGYRQRRQRRAQRLRLKGSTGNGSDCGGGGGGGGGGRTGPGFPNSNTLFHSMSTKRSRLVVMNSGLLGDPQQAVPDEGPSLGLGLVGGGGAIRKDVGSDAGRDGDVGE
ncbi:unnamed protein product, partial [Laminaria digitata]